MVVQNKRIEKTCCFYVSEFHLEMILVPYINEKINENITIIILFSNPALIVVNDKSLGIPVILHIDDATEKLNSIRLNIRNIIKQTIKLIIKLRRQKHDS